MSTKLELYLEALTKSLTKSFGNSPKSARVIQRMLIYPRYYSHLVESKIGYLKHKNEYSQNVIFIAGLPKSGTTWLDQMLASLPGFSSMMFPNMLFWGIHTGGSHDYELSSNSFAVLTRSLCVVKSHSSGSANNIQVLKNWGGKYIIMYRDVRDVAVSYVYFVRERPWHPEYPKYSNLSLHKGLLEFSNSLAPVYAEWIKSWENNRDIENSVVIRYEQMKKEPVTIFRYILAHFDIIANSEKIDEILSAYEHSRTKREATHFRKGIVGDWRNYFTDDISSAYKKSIGEALIELGYEQGFNW